jgi:hypothetical protein
MTTATSNAMLAARTLQEILDTQAEGYRRLLQSIERQREAIRTADLASVPTIAGVQEKIVERLRTLDARRESVGRALAQSLGLDAESTITAIVAVLPTEVGARLETRAARACDDRATRAVGGQGRRRRVVATHGGHRAERHRGALRHRRLWTARTAS